MTFQMTDSHLTEEQLSALHDQRLEAAEQAAAEAHLRDCADCQAELETLRATVALLRSLPAVEPPRDFRLPAPARPPLALRLVPWTRALGALAAGLFVVLISVDLLLSPFGGAQTTAGAPPAPTVAAPTAAFQRAERAAEAVQPTQPPSPRQAAPALAPRESAPQPAAPAARPAAPAPTSAPPAGPADAANDQAGAAAESRQPAQAAPALKPAEPQPDAASPKAAAPLTAPAPPAAAEAPAGAPPAAGAPAGAAPRPAPTLERPPATAAPLAQPRPTAPAPAPTAAPVQPAAEPVATPDRGSPLRPWQVAAGLLAALLLPASFLLARLGRAQTGPR